MHAKLITIYLVICLLSIFVWPTYRVWSRHGVWPVVFNRQASPGQSLIGFFFKLIFLGLIILSALAAWSPPDTLTVVQVPIYVSAIGWSLLVIGAAICALSQRQMGASWRIGIDDRRTELVTEGLFRYSRNPIFTGMLCIVCGYMLVLPAWWSLLIFITIWAGLRIQVVWEEKHLLKLHQDKYRIYMNRVGRFLPRIGFRTSVD